MSQYPPYGQFRKPDQGRKQRMTGLGSIKGNKMGLYDKDQDSLISPPGNGNGVPMYNTSQAPSFYPGDTSGFQPYGQQGNMPIQTQGYPPHSQQSFSVPQSPSRPTNPHQHPHGQMMMNPHFGGPARSESYSGAPSSFQSMYPPQQAPFDMNGFPSLSSASTSGSIPYSQHGPLIQPQLSQQSAPPMQQQQPQLQTSQQQPPQSQPSQNYPGLRRTVSQPAPKTGGPTSTTPVLAPVAPNSPRSTFAKASAKSASQEEFNMTQDEFPALPNARIGGGKSPGVSPQNFAGPPPPGLGLPARSLSATVPPVSHQQYTLPSTPPESNTRPPSGLSEDSWMTASQPLPPTLEESSVPEQDRFGLLGLASLMATEPSSDIAMLATGIDLSLLRLNLNSPERLCLTFESPFENVYSPADNQNTVPDCYSVEKVPSISDRIDKLSEEELFYVFYNMPGDEAQLKASKALYKKQWRFHLEQRIWVARIPDTKPEQAKTYERGVYYYFDVIAWKKLEKEMILQYDQLEVHK